MARLYLCPSKSPSLSTWEKFYLAHDAMHGCIIFSDPPLSCMLLGKERKNKIRWEYDLHLQKLLTEESLMLSRCHWFYYVQSFSYRSPAPGHTTEYSLQCWLLPERSYANHYCRLQCRTEYSSCCNSAGSEYIAMGYVTVRIKARKW
jgi:hypothetical protein